MNLRLKYRIWLHLYIILIVSTKLSARSCEARIALKHVFERYLTTRLMKTITCNKLISSDDLRRELNELLKTKMDLIEIYNSNIPVITTGLFETFNITQLLINYSNLQTIEKFAFASSKITDFNLEHNAIKNIESNSFQNTTRVAFLNLNNNSISDLEDGSFNGLGDLTKLILSNNLITNLNFKILNSLQMLQLLDLSHNKLSKIEINLFGSLVRLNSIRLDYNLIKNFNPNLFFNNSDIEKVTLSNNYIIDIDASQYPKSIAYIDASHNSIERFNFSNLPKLESIDLSYNSLIQINKESIEKLSYLNTFSVGHNFLEFNNFINEKSFVNLPELEVINLEDNHIRKLGYELFLNNSHLKKLNAPNNRIKEIDFSFFPKTIETINVSFNQLEVIKNMSYLESLSYLDVSHNRIKELRLHLFDGLRKLLYLDLSYNFINELNLGGFKDLEKLRILRLGFNNVSHIESGVFTGLTNINNLDLGHNNIKEFDENAFHYLTHLNVLNISYNMLNNTNVLNIIGHTNYLHEINLMGNYWSCISLVEIRRSYRSLKITSGTDYYVKNVFGISCYDNVTENKKNHDINDVYNVAEISKDLNERISYKLSTNNAMLILILIFFVVKLCLKYYTRSGVSTSKQFAFKKATSDQELQLI